MGAKLSTQQLTRSMLILLMMLFALSMSFPMLAQDTAEAEEEVTGDPLQLAFAVAREVAEEEHGSRITLVRWRYYEDNWSATASMNLYGAFGIDNCVDEVPMMLKRSDILFGWTFILTDTSGKEYQIRVSNDLAETVVCDEIQVPPQYGAPASSPGSAPVEVGPANAGPAGFALGGHVANLDGNAVGLMRRAGMTWVKKQLRFESGLGAGINIIKNAHAQDLKVLLGVVGDKNALESDFDGYVSRFAGFLGELAKNGADAIEVWNEPNIDREWPQGQINGGNYVKMLKPAYEAIKAANPNTWVISGAPAPTGFFGAAGCTGAGCNDDAFMAQMAQAGAAQYMDCLGLHYNEGLLSPTQNSGDHRRPNYPTRYFNAMLARGAQSFPNSKVCWTELGYLSGEGMGSAIPPGFAWAAEKPISVAEQAQWLAEAATLSRNSGRVSLMVVWNVNFTLWGADPQAGYAMLRPDTSCPACDSLGAAMRGGGVASS